MFQRAFQPDFELPNVTTLYGTTAKRLVTDASGRVTGVLVERPGEDGVPAPVEITARRL